MVPIDGTELTVGFGIANVGGSAGCNRFDGTYGSNGNVVRVGRLATTRLACADDVMAQETAFLEALQGAAFVERRGDTLVLRDRHDEAIVSMSKPAAEAAASASPEPTGRPSAEPTETATPKPTATAGASAEPTPKPTPAPTARPTPAPTPAPTLPPPASAPPSATCALTGPSGAQLASVVYPQSWYTLTEPADAACRYFDPNPISVPTEPGTVAAAITIRPDAAAYDDAVLAATDPANWTVVQSVPVTVSGLAATRIEATSIAPESGTPVGITLYSYIIDYGPAGTLTIQTSGTAGDSVYVANTLVVNLMAQASTFTPPSA